MLPEIKFQAFPEVAQALEWWSRYLNQGERGAGLAAHAILLHVLADPEQLRLLMEKNVVYLQTEGFLENKKGADDVDALRKRLGDHPLYKTDPPALGTPLAG
jgi:hypothetical protein